MYFATLLAFFVISRATTEHFSTNNRQIYGDWNLCDGCNCQYFSLYALEYNTQNPSDMAPPVYLYYTHNDYNYCTNNYQSSWLQITNNVPGLDISRSGRSAELFVDDLVDSNNNAVSINLSWSTDDSQNTNNCNCHNVYSYGIDTFRINSKSNYRVSQLTGSITINNVVHTVSPSSYSYVAAYGQKNLIMDHN